MNQTLHITERIEAVLNILQGVPGLQGYAQWNPMCDAMRALAGIAQDITKYEKEHAEKEKDSGGEENA